MPGDKNERRDWRISAILLAIWAVAMYLLANRRDDIPLPMMAIATVFFVFLVPAMNDLVRSIERRVLGDSGKVRTQDDRS